MSRFSVLVDGKHQDLTFRHKHTTPNSIHGPSNDYVLYVGDKAWGTVYNMRDSWTAVAHVPGKMNLVDGFATRMHAAWYIVKYVQPERKDY